jgi:hypothetical protein
MPAAAAVGMLDIVGVVGMIGIMPALVGGVTAGGAAVVPAIDMEADGGGASPGMPALPSARAPAINAPLLAIDAGAREPAALTGCEREGEVPELAGLHAPIANAASTPKRSPPPTRLHSRICSLIGHTRPTEGARPLHPRVSAVMP